MDFLHYQRPRLLKKSLLSLQQEMDNQKRVDTFCRRLGYVEKGALTKKIQTVHALLSEHGIDEKKALPLVGKYYAQESVQNIIEELGKIKEHQAEQTALFNDFSAVTLQALQERANIVTSLQEVPEKSLISRSFYRIGWKSKDQNSHLMQEDLLKKMKIALQSHGLQEVLNQERAIIAKRSPEKKAALVAKMLLGERRRVTLLENHLQVLKQEIAQEEIEGIAYMLPEFKRQKKQLEIALRVAKKFCEKATASVVAEYNAQEKKHLRQLSQIEQWIGS